MTRALPELTTAPDAFLTTASVRDGTKASENDNEIFDGASWMALPDVGEVCSSSGRACATDAPVTKRRATNAVRHADGRNRNDLSMEINR
jgi:hypothetical protein